MIHFTQKHFPAGEGSHMPVLIKMVQATKGDILELGTGFFSTPLLHWLCAEDKRKLVSYESNEKFVEVAKNFISDFHDVHWIQDWDTLPTDKHWSIVFIDHAPGKRRVEEMIRLANNADYVVVHDSEAKSDWHYNYSKGFPSYKYRYDYTKAYPNTTILSNFYDPSELWK